MSISLVLELIALAIGGCFTGVTVGRFLFGWFFERRAKDDIREFMQTFQGRCPVCSLHEYGVHYGYEKPGPPFPHSCLQAKKVLGPWAPSQGKYLQ